MEENRIKQILRSLEIAPRIGVIVVMCLMRLNFLEYLGYGEYRGKGMRYKETACSTLQAVNHIVWGKSNPRELIQQFVKTRQNASADSGFSGEPSRIILPQQAGIPKPYRLKARHLCTAPP